MRTQNQHSRSARKQTERTGLLAVAAFALIVMMTTPVQGDLHEPYQDLSVTVDAGEYMAYRVEMPSSGWVFAGGEFLDAASDQSVLPIVNFLDREEDAFAATAGFYYDDFRDEIGAVDVTINEEGLGNHNVHTHQKTVGDSPFPGLYFHMPAGTYNMVGLTGPADGEATIFLEVPEDAIVLDQERGEAAWARGLDESAVGYDIRALSQWGLAQADYHEWYYSGADVELDVTGGLYGYFGFGRYTEAHWQLDGNEHEDWVIGGATGTWTMSFPEEHYQWRNCVSALCIGDESQNLRLYPPYAIGIDLDWD